MVPVAPRVVRGELRQLGAAQRRRQRCHPRLDPKGGGREPAGWRIELDDPRDVAQTDGPIVEVPIIGQQHAPFPRRRQLVTLQAEDGDVAQTPARDVVPGGAVGVTRILYDAQTVIPGETL